MYLFFIGSCFNEKFFIYCGNTAKSLARGRSLCIDFVFHLNNKDKYYVEYLPNSLHVEVGSRTCLHPSYHFCSNLISTSQSLELKTLCLFNFLQHICTNTNCALSLGDCLRVVPDKIGQRPK